MSVAEQGLLAIYDKAKYLWQIGPNRQISLDIKDLVQRQEFVEGEEIHVVAGLSSALAALRGIEGIRSEYCRIDIVNSLAMVRFPLAQVEIVNSLVDPSEHVRIASEHALLDPNNYIFGETFEKLFSSQDSQIRAIGLNIIEKHPTGGLYSDSQVIGLVEDELDRMIGEAKTGNIENARRGVLLASHLAGKMKSGTGLPVDLFIRTAEFLYEDINETVIKALSEKDRFESLIRSITTYNLPRASNVKSIEDMEIVISPEIAARPEGITVLLRLTGVDIGSDMGYEAILRYNSLLALAKERSRERLAKEVADLKIIEEEERKKKLAEETAEKTRVTLEAEKNESSQRERVEADKKLALRAQAWFPNL